MRNPPARYFAVPLLIAAAISAFGFSPALAQQEGPIIKFNLLSVEGLTISDNYTIGADYGLRNGIPVPAPFRFKVPRQNDVTPLFETGKQANAMLVKINFTTGNADTDNSDRLLIENLQFVTMTLPLVEQEERMAILVKLLANDVLNAVTAAYEQKEYIGARGTKIGDYDAVEVIGKYLDPELGLMYARIVGIPNPDALDGIFAVANIVASRFDLQSPDDLALTGGGKTLSSFEYIKE